ncbi:tetratricopeptide repeat protein 25 [Trichonephila inaurata madagascariensis]|uniref:Outer dynein arm-docking complex subunit 4 n=1 Tax=Trichonephila inaurata madagascariensis TaxID=2747483 RepID=A0A8X7BSX4_9ARAC|nr:tetratricopeptide repeat protein 25 [Trichonephila inaurata madagascariensis]
MVIHEELEDEEATEKVSKFPITLHISEGNKLVQLFQFHKAMACFNVGLETQPNNIRCLLGKTRCLMGLGKYEEALQLAEEIIKLDPRYSEAFSLRGNANYFRGDFEGSLRSFSSVLRNQPHSLIFRLGKQVCEKAIDNSMDPDELLDQTDVTEVNKLLIDKTKKLDYRVRGNYFRKTSFAKDLKFMKSVLHDKDLSSVSDKCQDLYQYLKGREEFWRSQEPDLTRRPLKRKRKNPSSIQLLDLAIKQCAEAEKYLQKGDIEMSKKTCHKTLKFVKIHFKDLSQESSEIKTNIFHILGLACMFCNDISSALKYHKLELKIAEESGVVELKKKALFDIGEDYLKNKNFKQALMIFRQSLNFIESEEEKAIILYKIADCELHLDNLKNSANIGRKSLTIAASCNDFRLQCDATMLLAEISIKENDMDEAKKLYKDALQIAEENKDSRAIKIKDLIKFYDSLIERARLQIEKNITKKIEKKTTSKNRTDLEATEAEELHSRSDSNKLTDSNTELLDRTTTSNTDINISEESDENISNKKGSLNFPETHFHENSDSSEEKDDKNILNEEDSIKHVESQLSSRITYSDDDTSKEKSSKIF